MADSNQESEKLIEAKDQMLRMKISNKTRKQAQLWLLQNTNFNYNTANHVLATQYNL